MRELKVHGVVEESGSYPVRRTRREVIGSYHLEKVERFREQYEVAAWWTEIEVQPGIYPIELCRPVEGGGVRTYAIVRLPGVIVSAYTRALWCGVPFGSEPQLEQHRTVGQRTEYVLYVHDAERELGRILTAQDGRLDETAPADLGRWRIDRTRFSYSEQAWPDVWPVTHYYGPGSYGRGWAVRWGGRSV